MQGSPEHHEGSEQAESLSEPKLISAGTADAWIQDYARLSNSELIGNEVIANSDVNPEDNIHVHLSDRNKAIGLMGDEFLKGHSNLEGRRIREWLNKVGPRREEIKASVVAVEAEVDEYLALVYPEKDTEQMRGYFIERTVKPHGEKYSAYMRAAHNRRGDIDFANFNDADHVGMSTAALMHGAVDSTDRHLIFHAGDDLPDLSKPHDLDAAYPYLHALGALSINSKILRDLKFIKEKRDAENRRLTMEKGHQEADEDALNDAMDLEFDNVTGKV